MASAIRPRKGVGSNPTSRTIYAPQALLAMHLTCNEAITGSIPVLGSTYARQVLLAEHLIRIQDV